MRPPRRRSPLEHVLVAGDLTDADAVRALLALLPHTTYGQVYLEVPEGPEGTGLPDLAAPPRVTVTVLPRAAAAPVGDRLATAVQGWLAEWLPEEPDADRTVTMWVGGTASGRIQTAATCLERL